MLHDIDGETILRKLRHPAPALDEDIDPAIYLPFIPVKHEELMRKDLGLSHLVIGHGIGGKYIPIMARLAKARRWSKR